ncbi:hypothetical protein B0T19DRAFT_421643 [Cercophora scortea]|uniref:Uncharacterized protein n=1 Tax=Cercophora scortea TaxID=314031 RepID=A0AAE0ILV3_9PEZI|nr:hypothetical protein B0T19DRAFT_421643 [Cercophora scortea]
MGGFAGYKTWEHATPCYFLCTITIIIQFLHSDHLLDKDSTDKSPISPPVQLHLFSSGFRQKTQRVPRPQTLLYSTITMSPIIARAAFRAAAARSTGTATRQFSMVQNLRAFARSMEAHTPFERLPTTTKSQAADWGRHVRRVGGIGVIFFPAIFTFLGWPYAAELLLDGHMR